MSEPPFSAATVRPDAPPTRAPRAASLGERARGGLGRGAVELALALVVPFGLVALWYGLLEAGVLRPYQLPYPGDVLATLADLAARGELAVHTWATLRRVALGFAFGALAGLGFGAAVGLYGLADRVFDPTLQALRSIPSLAWVPLFLLWFGIGETSKVTLIALGVFFPVYLNLADGLRGVDRKLVEVGRVYGFGRIETARRILLPATLPPLLTGLRGGLGLGWMFVVAAELIAASSGLGFLMSEGRVMARPDLVVGSIVLFAVLGKGTDVLVQLAQRRLLGWQDTLPTR